MATSAKEALCKSLILKVCDINVSLCVSFCAGWSFTYVREILMPLLLWKGSSQFVIKITKNHHQSLLGDHQVAPTYPKFMQALQIQSKLMRASVPTRNGYHFQPKRIFFLLTSSWQFAKTWRICPTVHMSWRHWSCFCFMFDIWWHNGRSDASAIF